jgi:hypothetical protein
MVFRVVQRSKVVPVGLDLGAVGDIEADRAENFLDALPGAADRVQPAAAAAAARQRDVERLSGEPGFEFPQFQLFSAGIESRLDLLLGSVDPLPEGFLFFRRKGTQLPQQRGQLPGLAEVFRLGVFERCGIGGAGELRDSATNYFF